jgi:hypothetical protein
MLSVGAMPNCRIARGSRLSLDPDVPDLLVFRAQTFWSWNGYYQIEDAIGELRRAPGYNAAAFDRYWESSALSHWTTCSKERTVPIDFISKLSEKRGTLEAEALLVHGEGPPQSRYTNSRRPARSLNADGNLA